MTDFSFGSDYMDNPEVVSELEMEDYEKYRLKQDELTADLAIVDLEERDTEEYIDQRKDEISGSETEVPHPYKPEKQSKDVSGELVEFSGREGEGFADPEYNLVPEEGEGMSRYRYRVFWIVFDDQQKLCEVEIFAPKGSDIDLRAVAESLNIE